MPFPIWEKKTLLEFQRYYKVKIKEEPFDEVNYYVFSMIARIISCGCFAPTWPDDRYLESNTEEKELSWLPNIKFGPLPEVTYMRLVTIVNCFQ